MPGSEKLTSEIVCQIIDAADDAMIIADNQLTVRRWNLAAERLFGTEASEAIGQSVFDFISPTGLRATAISEFQTVDELCVPANSNCLLERPPKGSSSLWTERSTSRLQIDGTWWTLFVIRNVDVRKKREQKLQREASTDSLSQLANRRGFQTSLETNLTKPLTLGIVDIDQFKSVNDQWGHPVGDEVIKYVADKLRESFPSAISLGRMGGDEFGVILKAYEKEEAQQIFDQFIDDIASNKPNDSELEITVSIGVAISHSHEKTARDLLSLADRCMYQSKSEGRSRATVETF